ncbi:MAG: hypothetical protein PHG38_08905 [Bacteroidales bacterium]|nr:hypothetical protein [Bacteroidales bacterium]MDD4500368.1 hypothetical protein [Bacteroidales bacterium]MDD4827826.1 hypothetical protein [Bacteroidales bacterium]
MKRILISLILFLPVSFLSAQSDMLYERLYVSTDKECYLAGEQLWVSAFCYDASSGIPSPVSAVAYLEIQNLSGTVSQAKIALTGGRGSGMISLPLSIPTGIYRLSAYTRYMYSESNLNFFSKFVTIYNPLTSLRSDNVKTISERDAVTDYLKEKTEENSRGFTLLTNKKNYYPGEEVTITLHNEIPNQVSLSVSVYREDDLNYFRNRSIINYVDSTLKEKPSPFPLWKVDYAGEIIRGHVVDENNEPISEVDAYGSYISIAGSDIQYYSGEIRENGNVRFFTSNLYGDGTLVSYVPSFEQKKYHLVLDSVFMNPRIRYIPELILDKKQKDVLVERNMGVQIAQVFRLDTLIREHKPEANLLFENTGIVYNLDEYTRFPTMGEVMIEFIKEARFRTINGTRWLQVRLRDAQGVAYYIEDPTPPLVLVDGIPVSEHETIYAYDPNLVREITIYTDKYAFGPIYYNGILFFKTYKGDFPELELDESMRIQDFQGVQKPRSLAVLPADSRLPDLRHTLYWEPIVEVDANESITLKAMTSETRGTFCVVIEGMDRKGTPVKVSTDFTVK